MSTLIFISRCLFWIFGINSRIPSLFSRSPYIYPLKWKIILFKQPISQCKYSLVVPCILQKNVKGIKKVSSRMGQQEAAPERRDGKKKGKRVTFRLSPSHEKKWPTITPTEEAGEDSDWIVLFVSMQPSSDYSWKLSFSFFLKIETIIIITFFGLSRWKKEEKYRNTVAPTQQSSRMNHLES